MALAIARGSLVLAALLVAAGAHASDLFHGFEDSPTEHGFYFIQSKDRDHGGAGRVTLVPRAREGASAVKLTTQAGDSFVHGSDRWERTDLATSPAAVGGRPGESWWWANSFFLPDDFHMPRIGQEGYLLMDWHDDCGSRGIWPKAGQAPFNLGIAMLDGRATMQVRAYGGEPGNPRGEEQRAVIDPAPQKNVWYDFVHQIRWAADSRGRYRLWMRKGDEPAYRLVFERVGRPTLYAGCNVYLKLANYHGPYGVPSSVIHDRVVRGSSATAVALAPLEGLDGGSLARRGAGP